MRSFSRQKFNSNFIVANFGGGESLDFSQLSSSRSASISKMHLTESTTPTTMTAPRSIEGEFCSSFSKGDSTPIIKSVFLCLPFFNQRIFASVQIIMTALRVGRNPVVPLGDTANSFNAVTRLFAVLRDGFILQTKGITA
jgi:hypothetical protein